jgi:hypothetical protein
VLGILSALHSDLRGGAFDFIKIIGRELDFRCPDVLFQTGWFCGAWDGNDPRLLRQQPALSERAKGNEADAEFLVCASALFLL